MTKSTKTPRDKTATSEPRQEKSFEEILHDVTNTPNEENQSQLKGVLERYVHNVQAMVDGTSEFQMQEVQDAAELYTMVSTIGKGKLNRWKEVKTLRECIEQCEEIQGVEYLEDVTASRKQISKARQRSNSRQPEGELARVTDEAEDEDAIEDEEVHQCQWDKCKTKCKSLYELKTHLYRNEEDHHKLNDHSDIYLCKWRLSKGACGFTALTSYSMLQHVWLDHLGQSGTKYKGELKQPWTDGKPPYNALAEEWAQLEVPDHMLKGDSRVSPVSGEEWHADQPPYWLQGDTAFSDHVASEQMHLDLINGKSFEIMSARIVLTRSQVLAS